MNWSTHDVCFQVSLRLTLLVSLCLCLYIQQSSSTTVRLPSVPLTPNHMKAYSDRFCGPRLSTILSLICKGKYNARKKRDRKLKRINKRNPDFRLIYILFSSRCFWDFRRWLRRKHGWELRLPIYQEGNGERDDSQVQEESRNCRGMLPESLQLVWNVFLLQLLIFFVMVL